VIFVPLKHLRSATISSLYARFSSIVTFSFKGFSNWKQRANLNSAYLVSVQESSANEVSVVWYLRLRKKFELFGLQFWLNDKIQYILHELKRHFNESLLIVLLLKENDTPELRTNFINVLWLLFRYSILVLFCISIFLHVLDVLLFSTSLF